MGSCRDRRSCRDVLPCIESRLEQLLPPLPASPARDLLLPPPSSSRPSFSSTSPRWLFPWLAVSPRLFLLAACCVVLSRRGWCRCCRLLVFFRGGSAIVSRRCFWLRQFGDGVVASLSGGMVSCFFGVAAFSFWVVWLTGRRWQSWISCVANGLGSDVLEWDALVGDRGALFQFAWIFRERTIEASSTGWSVVDSVTFLSCFGLAKLVKRLGNGNSFVDGEFCAGPLAFRQPPSTRPSSSQH